MRGGSLTMSDPTSSTSRASSVDDLASSGPPTRALRLSRCRCSSARPCVRLPASFVAVGKSLVAIHDWTFLFGPSLAIGVNTLLLAYLMYTSRLVPRVIAVFGLIGGPVIFASGTAEMFGLYGQLSVSASIGAIPVFAWEMSLAVWLIVKGFNPSRITSSDTRDVRVDEDSHAGTAAG